MTAALAPVSLIEAVDAFLAQAEAARKLRAIAPIERRLASTMARLLARQAAAFLRRITPALRQMTALRESVPGWEADWSAVEIDSFAAMEGALDKAALAALRAGGRDQAAVLDLVIAFDLKNPRAVAYLRRAGAERVARINQTTRETIRSILIGGIEQGASYDRIARAIRSLGPSFLEPRPQRHIRDRAMLIAVTEAGIAYEAGKRVVTDDLVAGGLALEKSWLIVGDERTCPICQGNAQAGWIAYVDAFPSGHSGAIGHPACRCTTQHRRSRSPRPAVAPVTVDPAEAARIGLIEFLEDESRQIEQERVLAANLWREASEFQQQIYQLTGDAYQQAVDRVLAMRSQYLALSQQIDARAKDLLNRSRERFLYQDTPAAITLAGRPRDATRRTVADEGVAVFARLVGPGLLDGQTVRYRGIRGRANYWGNMINIAASDGARTVVHELGHWLDEKALLAKSAAFLDSRTPGEQPQSMRRLTGNRGYRSGEIAKPDKFLHPYMGKVYTDRTGQPYATEILSMGLEYLYAEPERFAREDPEYFRWVYGVVRGLV